MTARPYLLRRLSELRVIDDALEQALMRDGIVTPDDFALAACERRPIADNSDLTRAAGMIAADRPTITLGRAWELLDVLIAGIRRTAPFVEALEAAGAVRRGEPLVSGLTVVGRSTQPERAVEALAGLPMITDVVHRTSRRLLALFEGQEADIRIGTPDEYGTLCFAATGPAAHVAAVQERRGRRVCASEADVYTQAGLAYVPPELRDDPAALEAARRGELPPLVTHAQIRGDLHMHTTYSDGRDAMKTMIAAASALGYEYIAITDHSEHAGAARTLTADALARQRVELATLRELFPRLTILHGIEVDILPDGRLDCPDDTLASLDIVLASLHERDGQDGRHLTRRCVGAIGHPLVSVITHPSNQLVGRRPGYDMDYADIYAAAAETGTALEVDGAPAHLDLDGAHARAAVDAGATLVIDSDCHRVRALDRQMRMGVSTARRGWVPPDRVLNTRSIADVRRFLAAKRQRA